MIEAYKILHGMYDLNVFPALVRNMDSRLRGNALKLAVHRSRIDIQKFYFCNRMVKCWNSLPDCITSCGSLNSFKVSLDKHYKQNAIYFDFEAEL